MTKSELARAVARNAGVPQAMAARALDVILAELRTALRQERRVEIRGFGSFRARRYEGFLGRNPRSRAVVEVKPKLLPTFRAGKELRALLNPGEESA